MSQTPVKSVQEAYKLATVQWGVPPSEFWGMHPQEFWIQAEARHPEAFAEPESVRLMRLLEEGFHGGY